MFSNKRSGFTLVELLTVIAIIAILAAIIFPVMASAKRKAREKQCMTNLHDIFAAVRMFEQDEHRYPEFIAGPVEFTDKDGNIVFNPNENPPDGGAVARPIKVSKGLIDNRVVSLYPSYIKSVDNLKCPDVILNGEGKEYKADDYAEDPMYARLKDLGFTDAMRVTPDPTDPSESYYKLYKLSTYDFQSPPWRYSDEDPTPSLEAHYSTIWSNSPVGTVGLERQLRWRDPPTDTVICWCSYHRNLNKSGEITRGSMDMVLFLDGRVKRVQSNALIPWTSAWKEVVPSD